MTNIITKRNLIICTSYINIQINQNSSWRLELQPIIRERFTFYHMKLTDELNYGVTRKDKS
jgi:hypothetical protein